MAHMTTSDPPTLYSAGETRREYLIRIGKATPRFLQGVFPFAGRGVFDLNPLDDGLGYTVPEGKIAELVYVRAGNLSDEALYLAITGNGKPLRYFPLGPGSDSHVELAIVEPHRAGTRLEICLAAPRGLTGAIVVDVGLVEMETQP